MRVGVRVRVGVSVRVSVSVRVRVVRDGHRPFSAARLMNRGSM